MAHNHTQSTNDDPQSIRPEAENTPNMAPDDGVALGTLKTLGSMTFDARVNSQYNPDENDTEDASQTSSKLSNKVEAGSLWIISKFGISSIGFVIMIYVVFKMLEAFNSIP